jgi:hypothetical protein
MEKPKGKLTTKSMETPKKKQVKPQILGDEENKRLFSISATKPK